MKRPAKNLMKVLGLILVAAAALAVFASCEVNLPGKDKEKTGLYIVCTIFPQYDFVKNIVGDLATVDLLMPPGS